MTGVRRAANPFFFAMHIRPADLGGTLAVDIVKARVATANAGRRNGRLRAAFSQTASSKKQTHLNALDKLFLQGTGFSSDNEQEAIAVLAPMRQSMLLGFLPMLSMIPALSLVASHGHIAQAAMVGTIGLGAGGAVSVGSFLGSRQMLAAPLTEDELVNLIVAKEEGSLQQAFIRLVRNFAKQDNISPEAQDNLRGALRSLGQAIERLPHVGSGSPQSTAEELRRNVETVRRRADAEIDPLTQASLNRQADALEQSAQAAERSSVLIRRTQALREELFAQIESLRLGLTAFYTGDADVSGLSQLSENVRTVAAEAISLSDPRAELDAATTPNRITLPQATPETVVVGQGR